MALSLLPHLMTLSLKQLKEDREVMILAATSGDTGKAALEGFKDVEGTSIKVFYPLDGVSAIQQQQMVSQEGKNVKVVEFMETLMMLKVLLKWLLVIQC